MLLERQLTVRATVFDHANFKAGIRRRANIRLQALNAVAESALVLESALRISAEPDS